MQVLKQNGNLLMLDEPTNDADVDLLRALENAINQWPGTVLCISHVRRVLRLHSNKSMILTGIICHVHQQPSVSK